MYLAKENGRDRVEIYSRAEVPGRDPASPAALPGQIQTAAAVPALTS